MDRMNILVTGASGQLGRAIEKLSGSSRHRFVFTSHNADEPARRLDVTDAGAVRRAVGQDVDVIINCAAYTDVNGAEDNETTARAVNAEAVSVLADAALESGALLMHFSTDYIFDGYAATPYREDDTAGPVNVYGKTKLEGEQAITGSGCRHIILRTSWLYGCSGRNFFTAIADKTAACPRIKVVDDQIGCPTYVGDFANAVMHIVENGFAGAEGIYHYANGGVCSRYEFAKEICASLGHVCEIVPCRSGDFPSKAVRPHYSALDTGRFRETFALEIPDWRASLRLCAAEMMNMKKI